jgi:hypothetical protein
MPSTPDPWSRTDRPLWRAAPWLLLVLGLPFAWWLARWAFAPLPPPLSAALEPPPAPATTRTAPLAIDASAWQVTLWQPLRDAPPPVVERAPPPPLDITLFAIAQHQGQPRATFDAPEPGLFHLRPGETAHGLTLERIEGRRVHVLWQGEARVLEFSSE